MRLNNGYRSLLLASALLGGAAVAGCAGNFDDYYADDSLDAGSDSETGNPDASLDGGDDAGVDAGDSGPAQDFGVGPFDVTLNVSGTGAGSIVSAPTGINCGSDCMETYASGTVLTLIATPDTGSEMASWGGACSGTAPTDPCVLTVDRPLDVDVVFDIPTFTLTVSFEGGATGTVSALDASLNCDGTGVCSADYLLGTEVTLTAAAAEGAAFMGWSVDCVGSGDCVLTMDEDKTVGATFDDATQVALLVSRSGTGTGSVTSAPAGVDCGDTCSGSYDPGTEVTLTAAADTGSNFAGWSGDCTGTGTTCVVTMSASRNVTARFDINEYTITAERAGTGTGSVRSLPTLIDCGTECSATYTHDTYVALTATADEGSTFTGWSGPCSGTATCEFDAMADATAVATFTLNRYTLDVAATGPGDILSSAGGISCGSDCTEDYDHGTDVTLNAVPNEGATFDAWTGACAGTATTESCVVSMTAAASAGATFTLNQYTVTASTTDDGAGTITSSVGGINCGDGNTSCDATIDHGTSVMFTATAASNSTFIGWGGACAAASGNTCTVEITDVTAVSAAFILGDSSLSVTKNGPGTVTSSPVGIDCGSTCASSFTNGTTVQLTPAPDTGASFVSWVGCDSEITGGAEPVCEVLVDSAKSVAANFAYDQHQLTVSVPEGGTVTSSAGDISCASGSVGDCGETLDFGTTRTLTAAADDNYQFLGWSGGGCSGTGACIVTIDGDVDVTATFGLVPRTLTVTTGGTGTGTVVDGAGEVSCGSDCEGTYDHGTMVTLTASPSADSVFSSWDLATCGTATQCVVTMDQARTVNATFTLRDYTLTVTKDVGSGSFVGSGTVTADVGSIDCGSECSDSYSHGTTVTLSAVASSNSTFTGWSGEGCSGTATCVVDMTSARNVTATFARNQYTLTVTRDASDGTGSVSSNPSGLTCPVSGDCTGTFFHGQAITLTPSAADGSVFSSWAGCTPAQAGDTCSITLTAAAVVDAVFDIASYPLNVAISGSGAGTVTSSPGAINCSDTGGTCTDDYLHDTTVTLTATAGGGGSSFQGWSGCDTVASNVCTVTLQSSRDVDAIFADGNSLTVVIDDDAGGNSIQVTSSPGAIDCQASNGTSSGTCTDTYALNDEVTLSATYDTASTVFIGWSGGGCSGTADCMVTMSAATTVTAQFAYRSFSVDVAVDAEEMGSVTSGDGQINCAEENCSGEYTYGDFIELQADPLDGYDFDTWEGCDSFMGNVCVMEVTTDLTITAFFKPQFHTITVNNSGDSGGSVVSGDGGIGCGTDCSESYPTGTNLFLEAVSQTGFEFVSWNAGGPCAGQPADCNFTVVQAQTVQAIFQPTIHDVNVTIVGNFEGDVNESPAGQISCQSTGDSGCTGQYAYGTSVTLVASGQSPTNSPGYDFVRWGTNAPSECAGSTNSSCTFVVRGTVNIDAEYRPNYLLRVNFEGGTGTFGETVTVQQQVGTFWLNVGTCEDPRIIIPGQPRGCSYTVYDGLNYRVVATTQGFLGWTQLPTGATCTGLAQNTCAWTQARRAETGVVRYQ